ncbi:MAG: hypothetical protein UDN39_11520, partial [Christensenellales bacterium]|nr:hypothetical protein [Christensenellales bacterium]
TWESRTLPDSAWGYAWESRRKGAEEALCIRYVRLSGRFQANVQHCTWLGSTMCAASGGSSTWGNTWENRTLPDCANPKSSTHSELLMLASECESLKEFRKRLQGIIDRQ